MRNGSEFTMDSREIARESAIGSFREFSYTGRIAEEIAQATDTKGGSRNAGCQGVSDGDSLRRSASDGRSAPDADWRSVPCKPWPGRKRHDGYGIKYLPDRKSTGAHRWVWEQAHGSIPDGLCVCHHCDNPPCAELAHLFLGTKQDNSDDAVAKGRSLHGERAPSAKLTEAEVLEVRELRAAGVPVAAIAYGFEVTTRTVYYVCRGERWRRALQGRPAARPARGRVAA